MRDMSQLSGIFWNVVDDIPRPGSFHDDLSLSDKRYINEILKVVSNRLYTEGRRCSPESQITYICKWPWPLHWRKDIIKAQRKRVAATCKAILTKECGWIVDIEAIDNQYRIALTPPDVTPGEYDQLDFFNEE